MDHVAIMKKSWGLTRKILLGKKKIESRWYVSRRAPWNKVSKGDAVYFKDSGEPVSIKAEVSKVLQFSDLTPQDVKGILGNYWKGLGIDRADIGKFYELFKNKKYCILVFLKNPEKTEPFCIDKTGSGMMSAWISVDSIDAIKTTC